MKGIKIVRLCVSIELTTVEAVAVGLTQRGLSGIDERARKTSVIKISQPEAIHFSPRSNHCPFPRPNRPVCGSHVTSWIGGTSQVAVFKTISEYQSELDRIQKFL